VTDIDLTLRIEPMRVHDASVVAEMVRTVVEPLTNYNALARRSEVAKYSADQLVDAITDDPYAVAVARRGGEAVGFSISKFDDYLIWIAWLGVLPSARRRGVARALLADIEQTARLRGAHKVWADSRTDNAPMAALFPSVGYERIATLEQHWYRQDFHLWHKIVD
jgi:ribosomal protein S18 acetylase RimI-like enzyme